MLAYISEQIYHEVNSYANCHKIPFTERVYCVHLDFVQLDWMLSLERRVERRVVWSNWNIVRV